MLIVSQLHQSSDTANAYHTDHQAKYGGEHGLSQRVDRFAEWAFKLLGLSCGQTLAIRLGNPLKQFRNQGLGSFGSRMALGKVHKIS